MGTLGFAPGVGSLEEAARGPELSSGGKRDPEQEPARVCRPLNSRGTRHEHENPPTATAASYERMF